MKNKHSLLRPAPLVLLIFLNACSGNNDSDPNPVTIKAINPDNGTAGTAVTITGTGFGIDIADNTVKFNNKEATVTSASATTLMAEVPQYAGTGPVTVQVGSNAATGPEFSYFDEPQTSKSYYVKFKADGSWKLFEDGEPGYQACGECSCCYLPALNDTRKSGVEICQATNDWVVAADILSWDQKKIGFQEGSGYPVAGFGYKEDGEDYHSGNASDQTDSWVKVSKVEEDGQLVGYKAYKITGTFQCKVADSQGGADVSITEGSFVIRYTEDY